MSIVAGNQTIESIRSGDWSRPVILVYGKDTLAVEETVDGVSHAVREGNGSVQSVDGRRLRLQELLDEIAQISLFAERRLFCLNGLPPRADVLEKLVRNTLDTTDTLLLVRVEGDQVDRIDRRLRWYKMIAKEGVALPEFKEVKEREVPGRIGELARAIGLTITGEGSRLLADRVGTNLLTARQELEKLSLYIHPEKRIGADHVESVVGRSREKMIFAITEGISGRDRGKALADLSELLQQGASGGAIISLLARQARFLMQARLFLRENKASAGLVRNYSSFQSFLRKDFPPEWLERFGARRGNLFRQHPYVIFLHLNQALRFRESELFRLLSSLSRADRAIKSGAGSEQTVLFTTVAAASTSA